MKESEKRRGWGGLVQTVEAWSTHMNTGGAVRDLTTPRRTDRKRRLPRSGSILRQLRSPQSSRRRVEQWREKEDQAGALCG
ncbi:hypothetical protein NDU88_004462 [Pleurodeles waltl]|uniref:Uncharacterized protein n=1 Tax=Pleurodeles waltl TaxID=8319 RepID=A0AAV7V327_PLEWA|nr:hypothetical protein NDU88_004462 [Pleurodeles waltl]